MYSRSAARLVASISIFRWFFPCLAFNWLVPIPFLLLYTFMLQVPFCSRAVSCRLKILSAPWTVNCESAPKTPFVTNLSLQSVRSQRHEENVLCNAYSAYPFVNITWTISLESIIRLSRRRSLNRESKSISPFTSVCIFSILFSIHILRCWRGIFAQQSIFQGEIRR